jgi:hypothetical protein
MKLWTASDQFVSVCKRLQFRNKQGYNVLVIFIAKWQTV